MSLVDELKREAGFCLDATEEPHLQTVGHMLIVAAFQIERLEARARGVAANAYLAAAPAASEPKKPRKPRKSKAEPPAAEPPAGSEGSGNE